MHNLYLFQKKKTCKHGPSMGRLNSRMPIKISFWLSDRIEGMIFSGLDTNLSRHSKCEIINEQKTQMVMWRKLSLFIWNWSLSNSCISLFNDCLTKVALSTAGTYQGMGHQSTLRGWYIPGHGAWYTGHHMGKGKIYLNILVKCLSENCCSWNFFIHSRWSQIKGNWRQNTRRK